VANNPSEVGVKPVFGGARRNTVRRNRVKRVKMLRAGHKDKLAKNMDAAIAQATNAADAHHH
jgi:hypothetical protein